MIGMQIEKDDKLGVMDRWAKLQISEWLQATVDVDYITTAIKRMSHRAFQVNVQLFHAILSPELLKTRIVFLYVTCGVCTHRTNS